MIIGRDFVFVLPPKSASSSICDALRGHGVETYHRHEPLFSNPPHPVVAAVFRPWADILESAGRNGVSVVYGDKCIEDCKHSDWFRYVTLQLDFNNLEEGWVRFLDVANLPDIPLPHLNRRSHAACS